MADTLELPGGKSVDLGEVKGLSDEEYNGLLAYATQWDNPNQAEWREQIQKARGEAPTDLYEDAETNVSDELPEDGTIAEVMAWVGDDAARAQVALDAENEYAEPRSTLVDKLEALVEG